MAKPLSFGQVNLDVSVGRDRSSRKPEPETPFRIAILGDFSGRANRGCCETGGKLAKRRSILVDRDNFDDVLAKLGPAISLPLDGASLALQFAELDDFHPDRIFERAGVGDPDGAG